MHCKQMEVKCNGNTEQPEIILFLSPAVVVVVVVVATVVVLAA